MGGMSNPLLHFEGLPLWDQVRPEHVGPAMDELLARADQALAQVTQPDFPADWNAIARALDVATDRLGRAWGMVGHLNAVADTPELRAAYNEALPRVTEFWTRLGSDEKLYAKYKAVDPAGLAPEQQQALKNALRNFRLSGAELTGSAKERYAQIQERQAELTQKYSENALDATDAFAYYASENELEGVPADVVHAARAAAEADGQVGYKLTLKMPCYLPVMQFAKSSALRERLYRAYVTRASEFGDPAFDNTALITEILALREEEAKLLGYANFGELSVVPKMAESPEQVVKFLRDLAAKARPYGERDVAELREFAAKELGLADPQPWDWSYVGEKLKEARYAFSEQEVKQYFPAPKVLAGLFKIVETLFEVDIRRDSALPRPQRDSAPPMAPKKRSEGRRPLASVKRLQAARLEIGDRVGRAKAQYCSNAKEAKSLRRGEVPKADRRNSRIAAAIAWSRSRRPEASPSLVLMRASAPRRIR